MDNLNQICQKLRTWGGKEESWTGESRSSLSPEDCGEDRPVVEEESPRSPEILNFFALLKGQPRTGTGR